MDEGFQGTLNTREEPCQSKRGMPCAVAPECCARSEAGICAGHRCHSTWCPRHGSSAKHTRSLSCLLYTAGMLDLGGTVLFTAEGPHRLIITET